MNSNLSKSILSAILLTLAWPMNGLPYLFLSHLSHCFKYYIINLKKIKTNNCSLFLSFFLWNLGISWWIWNASAFGMFFAVLVNSSLMTVVFMFSRTVIKKAIETSWIVISDHLLDEFRTPAPSLGFFVALASTRKCIF
ncbi:MAG: hypothetical protein CM15mP32_3870 [Flavobacteriaceae bacterium]|nr:MAG: hypothetical protein CM15mP32_3870 [Flavobacteriaceae bacterium]